MTDSVQKGRLLSSSFFHKSAKKICEYLKTVSPVYKWTFAPPPSKGKKNETNNRITFDNPPPILGSELELA